MFPRTLILSAFSAVAALDLAAGLARGQVSVDFRIVERTGQSVVSPIDNVLNLTVQARVNSPGSTVGLGGYNIAMIVNGEAESRGTLSRDLASEADHTYAAGTLPAAPGSYVGLPSQFTYLSNLDARFNGLINSSAGSWVQTQWNDIGLVEGSMAAQALLNTPGVDPDGDGIPNGTGTTIVTLPHAIMANYFGAGQYVDIYRFRYVVSDFANRTINFTLVGDTNVPTPGGYTFSTVHDHDGIWGNLDIGAPPATVSNLQILSIGVIPAPASVAMLGIGAVVAGSRRRAAGR